MNKSSDYRSLIDSLVRTIVKISAPEKVILFGSQAKGTATETSDYDFLVIESEPFGETGSRRKEASKLGWALSEFGIVADVLIYSPEEIERRRDWKSSVVASALNEGKVLYEQA